MDWQPHLIALAAGLAVSVLTVPVGVSGAVFLLPVQLDLLRVPNPQVTPTNLLFNVVSAPGALLRYRAQGQLAGPLTRLLVLGTVPGVVVGATLRVYVLPGPMVFRVLAAALLLPIGLYLLRDREPRQRTLSNRQIVVAAAGVGVVGGVYGIGGGSILGPFLVGAGYTLATVAPAALASTFVTSVAGALTFALLARTAEGAIAPDWSLGLACGLGGLVGGHLGARLQPKLPDRVLRRGLGAVAVGLAALYVVQAAVGR